MSASIGDNGSLFSDKKELAMIDLLLQCGQKHLFDAWPAKGIKDQQKQAMIQQCLALDDALAPAGIKGYVERAKALLKASKEGQNPYEGYIPQVPDVASFETKTPEGLESFQSMEAAGVKQYSKACFVLVAGGLGERLGYHGIKIALPTEVTTETTYAEYYCRSILAMQERARAEEKDDSITLPLAIMTSGDTDARTRELFKVNNNFGMAEGQVTLMKQEKVPALLNNSAHFAFSNAEELTLETKPHGHGDVHTLLYQHKLPAQWAGEGRKWLLFFQDTNGLVFKITPLMLGVSASKSLAVNILTIPRVPGEAVGAICKLTSESKPSMTINVEYNQLDALMKANGKTDAKLESGYSPYPGNTNVMIFDIPPYAETLSKTQGVISEFVNPKYADKERETFKKPTRLECMMQDYPKLLDPSVRVGATQAERCLCFSAVKNNSKDALAKVASTGFGECGATGEADFYEANRLLLSFAGADISVQGGGDKAEYLGIAVNNGAHVVLDPSFATTVADVKQRIAGKNVKISDASSLSVSGNVKFESLDLDGALSISACAGASVTVQGLQIKNAGRPFQATKGDDADEKYMIRGYTCPAGKDAISINITKPGNYVVGKDGKVTAK